MNWLQNLNVEEISVEMATRRLQTAIKNSGGAFSKIEFEACEDIVSLIREHARRTNENSASSEQPSE